MPNWLKELLDAKKLDKDIAETISQKLSNLENEVKEYKTKFEDTQKTLNEVTKSKEKFESELANLDEKIKRAKEEGKSELVSELEKERNEKQSLMEKLQTLESKNKELTINTELSKVLENVGVIDKEVAELALKNFVDVNEDGKVIFKNGDEIVDLDIGAKKFFENKPHLLQANGQAGSGANANNPSGATKKRSEMNVAEKAQFIASNGRDAYENLQN